MSKTQTRQKPKGKRSAKKGEARVDGRAIRGQKIREENKIIEAQTRDKYEQHKQALKTGGRPHVYNEEIASEILTRIASGESVTRILEDNHLPAEATFYNWLLSDNPIHDGLVERYKRARAIQRERYADELVDIADDGRNDLMVVKYGDEEYERENKEVTNRSKLRVNTRQWLLSKLEPNKYGEKAELLLGDENGPIKGNQIVIKRMDNSREDAIDVEAVEDEPAEEVSQE